MGTFYVPTRIWNYSVGTKYVPTLQNYAVFVGASLLAKILDHNNRQQAGSYSSQPFSFANAAAIAPPIGA